MNLLNFIVEMQLMEFVPALECLGLLWTKLNNCCLRWKIWFNISERKKKKISTRLKENLNINGLNYSISLHAIPDEKWELIFVTTIAGGTGASKLINPEWIMTRGWIVTFSLKNGGCWQKILLNLIHGPFALCRRVTAAGEQHSLRVLK